MFEGAVIGRQVVLYSMLVMYSFNSEDLCERASEIAHAANYEAGGCLKHMSMSYHKYHIDQMICGEMLVEEENDS